MLRTAAIALLLAATALAADHIACNGTWVLVPEKSDFGGGSAIRAATLTINDREGNITVSRNFTYEGGNETVFYSDTTDGERNATIHSGGVASKTRWEHGSLKVVTTRAGATTIETYSIGPAGTLTGIVETPAHKTLKLVFQRQ